MPGSVVAEYTAEATATASSIAVSGVVCQAGDCLHILVSHGNTGGTNMAATPLTNTGTAITFSAARRNLDDATNHQRLVSYTADNVPAQTTTITATFNNANASFRAIRVKVVRGCSAWDKGAGQLQASPTTSANATTSGNTAALAAQPAVVSGFCVATASATTTAVGTGYSSDQTTAWQFGSGVDMSASESKRVTATTAVAATFTAAANDARISVVEVFTESASSGLTLNATTQALTLTGQQATVILGRTLNATTQALTLTGQQATAGIGRTLNATTQALTLTGQQATVSRGRTLNATTQALTLTGQQANVQLGTGLTLNATTQALTLVGQPADVIGTPAVQGGYPRGVRRYFYRQDERESLPPPPPPPPRARATKTETAPIVATRNEVIAYRNDQIKSVSVDTSSIERVLTLELERLLMRVRSRASHR